MALDHGHETPLLVADNQPCKSGKNVVPCCINSILTDDCLRAVLSKLQIQSEKDTCSLVCKRWLAIQSGERKRIAARAGPLMLQRLAARFTSAVELDLGQSASRSFYPGVSDSDLQTIARSFRILEHINLEGCSGITDKGLEALGKGIPGLKSVVLSNCKKISNKGIEALASSCTKLIRLQLSASRLISDGALEALSKNCKDLELLDVSVCSKITDRGVQALAAGCHRLQTLHLSSCEKVGDVSSLGSLSSSLQLLNLNCCPEVTDESVTSFARQVGAKNVLETLLLSSCKRLTSSSIIAVAENCGESLRQLNLNECSGITDEAFMQVFQRCKVMETLELCSTQITDSALEALQGSVKLKSLRLCHCGNITDSGVSKLASYCTSLEVLDLRWCEGVNGEGFAAAGFPPTCKVLLER